MKGKKNVSTTDSNSIDQMPGILKYHIQQKSLKNEACTTSVLIRDA